MQHKVYYTKGQVVLNASGKHEASIHVNDSSSKLAVSQKAMLAVGQKAMLRRVTKCLPNETARQLAQNTSNFNPKSSNPQDLNLLC